MADPGRSPKGLLVLLLLAVAVVLIIQFYRPAGKKNVVEKGLDVKAMAAEAETRANLQGVESAVVAYLTEAGDTPKSLADLRGLRLLPGGAIDGWGRPLRYERISDSSFRVISAGKDGAFGTADDLVREY
jgi:hypothetical protein